MYLVDNYINPREHGLFQKCKHKFPTNINEFTVYLTDLDIPCPHKTPLSWKSFRFPGELSKNCVKKKSVCFMYCAGLCSFTT